MMTEPASCADREPDPPAVAERLSLRGAVWTWEADLDAFLARAPRWAERLSRDERRRAARLGPVGAQARYVVRRILLRHLLQRAGGLPAGDDVPAPGDDEGSATGGVHYAVGQREGLTLIALAARPIGLALHRVDTVVNELLPDALARSERAVLARLPASRTAVAAAVLLASKQAYRQARNADVELSSVVIALAEGEAPRLYAGIAGDDPAGWTLALVPTEPRHVAVLAVPGGADWRLERHRVNELPDWA